MAGNTFDPDNHRFERKRRRPQGRYVRSLDPSDGTDTDELAIARNEKIARRGMDSDIRAGGADEADIGYGPDEAEDDRGLH